VPSRFRADERGGVTAEFAVALPAVVMVLACCLSGMQVAGQQLRLQDAAAVAARSLARGDSPDHAVSRLAPGGTISRSEDGDLVCATVSVGSVVFGLPLSARSCALGGGR